MDRTPPPYPSVAELERQFDIPSDTYCGLTPEHMSRAIVAYHGGPRRPVEPVGSMPVGSEAHRLDWLREEFGDDADVDGIRVLVQFFGGRVSRAMKLYWMLPNDEFDRAVSDGLRRHFPELTEDARLVIAGNYSYSHAK